MDGREYSNFGMALITKSSLVTSFGDSFGTGSPGKTGIGFVENSGISDHTVDKNKIKSFIGQFQNFFLKII